MKAILLHPNDNVLVVIGPVEAGDTILIDGEPVRAGERVRIGHKIARRTLVAGDKVLKYGAPIGSMTAAADAGAHVHLHNMKSDYIASHGRDALERSTHP